MFANTCKNKLFSEGFSCFDFVLVWLVVFVFVVDCLFGIVLFVFSAFLFGFAFLFGVLGGGCFCLFVCCCFLCLFLWVFGLLFFVFYC